MTVAWTSTDVKGGSSRTTAPDSPRLLDHVGHGPLADALRELVLMDAVPGATARPARDRLHEIRLRPRDVAFEALAAVLRDDLGELPVELRERDELRLVDRDPGGHGAPVELVEHACRSTTPFEGQTEPVSLAPGISADRKPKLAREPNVEPAGRENQRPLGPCPGTRSQGMAQ